MEKNKKIVEKIIEEGNGILKLKPAWVARKHIPAGGRFQLDEKDYNLGERGCVNERWLASTTVADNEIGPEDEGLSYINSELTDSLSLKDAVSFAPDIIMGKGYSENHTGLGRLAKLLDYGCRIPFHLHQMEKDAKLVGAKSKDEAYYFPEGFDMGKNPETFFGVHPYISEHKKYDILLPYLEKWDSDLILKHSKAYLNVAGDGFLLQSGILHAPGSAMTVELQEDSDVGAILQAKVEGKIISKELLYKDVSRENREKYRERAVLNQVDWDASGDPYFYENHHLEPVAVENTKNNAGMEFWIYYGTPKFSGKKLTIKPGKTYKTLEKGVYNILVLKGEGLFGGIRIKADDYDYDELLITHNRAIRDIDIKNTGKEDLIIIKFFGPDINDNCPSLK